jgi:hypothetical protein
LRNWWQVSSRRLKLRAERARPRAHSRSMQRRSSSCAAGQNLVNRNSPLCSVWSLVRFEIGSRGGANQLDLPRRCYARSATIRSTLLERYLELPNLNSVSGKSGAARASRPSSWLRADDQAPTFELRVQILRTGHSHDPCDLVYRTASERRGPSLVAPAFQLRFALPCGFLLRRFAPSRAYCRYECQGPGGTNAVHRDVVRAGIRHIGELARRVDGYRARRQPRRYHSCEC